MQRAGGMPAAGGQGLAAVRKAARLLPASRASRHSSRCSWQSPSLSFLTRPQASTTHSQP